MSGKVPRGGGSAWRERNVIVDKRRHRIPVYSAQRVLTGYVDMDASGGTFTATRLDGQVIGQYSLLNDARRALNAK